MNENKHMPFMQILLAVMMLVSCNIFAQDEKNNMKICSIAYDSGKFWMTIENTSEIPQYLIAKSDPDYGVIKIQFKDSASGKNIEFESMGVDWLADVDDIFIVPSKIRVSLPFQVNIDKGEYDITAQYVVTKDSFFIDPYLKDAIRGDNDAVKYMKIMSQNAWKGTMEIKNQRVIVSEKMNKEKPKENKKHTVIDSVAK